jgi:hypothetical protein
MGIVAPARHLPIIYLRGYAGGPSGISSASSDPFTGFNEGSVQVRVSGADQPVFHQFEGPLIRLMTDHQYELHVEGDQRRLLEQKIAQGEHLPEASLWVHRYYDAYARSLQPNAPAFSMESAADSLLEFVDLVLTATGAPQVHLVAHSMGGLVARSMLQRTLPQAVAAGRTGPADPVARLFTYGTPHGGIEFDLGGGLIETLRDLTGFNGADVFGPRRMREYLLPTGVVGPQPFDARVIAAGPLTPERVFCLVGTNPDDYDVAFGMSARAVGPRSDGLVQVDNAVVVGAPHALVHRSHSGRFGMVNSEEGYQNLERFLLGDLEVVADAVDLAVPPRRDTVWQLETSLAVRGLPALLHEQSTAHLCPVQLDPAGPQPGPVPLARTYLMSGAPRAGQEGRPDIPMRYVLRLRLLSLEQAGGILWFGRHLEQTAEWQDDLVVDVRVGSGGPEAWASWASQIRVPLREWDPTDGPTLDTAPDGTWSWIARVPVPAAQQGLLGTDAAVRLRVRPHALN